MGTYSGQLKQDFLLSAESRKIGTLTLLLQQKNRNYRRPFMSKEALSVKRGFFLPKESSFCQKRVLSAAYQKDYFHLICEEHLQKELAFAKVVPFCRKTEGAFQCSKCFC